MRYRLVGLAVLLPIFGACADSAASDTSTPPAITQIPVPATTVATAPATTATPVPAATAAPAAVESPAASVPAATNEATVGIADFAFAPAEVRVPVGGSVVWTNNDAQPHTATSAGSFDAGAIEPQKSATAEFPKAGTFAYICAFHPFMTGTVVVA